MMRISIDLVTTVHHIHAIGATLQVVLLAMFKALHTSLQSSRPHRYGTCCCGKEREVSDTRMETIKGI